MPNDRAKLIELAERCEAARGPDRELDRDIARLLNLPWDYAADWGPRGSEQPTAYPYTASLDAALMLVPERWTLFHLDGPFNDSPSHATVANGEFAEGSATTPALALTSAALRAQGEMS